MKNRKAKALLSAILAAGVLAACASTGTAPTAAESPAAPAQTDAAQEAADEASVQEVEAGSGETVTIWECNWGGSAEYEEALKKLAQEATDANIDGKGYKIEVQMVSWDSFYETFMTAAVAGSAPDIAWQASTAPFEYADMGYTLDLQPIYYAWVAEGNPIVENTPDTAWNFLNYKGQLVGIPVGGAAGGFIYRKDIFEAAGVEKLPTTYDEFLDVCQKVKDYGVTPIVLEGGNAGFKRIGEYAMLENGTGACTPDFKSAILSDANRQAYEFVRTMYENEYIPRGLYGFTVSDAERMFLNGEAAMYECLVPTSIEPDNEKIGVLPIIGGPSVDKGLSSSGAQSYYAYNQGGHDEATLAVLKWWIENNDILWTEGHNTNVPLDSAKRERVIDNELVLDFCEVYAGPDAWVGTYYPLPRFTPLSNAIETEDINSGVVEAIFSGEDMEEAMQRVDAELNDLLEEYAEDIAE